MNRAQVQPILNSIPAARQGDARHYGVHPYFTRRPANVVRAYVERYSRDDDVVLDPFGGTGVTAIEAFLLGRHAIHNDLNPFANFIARNIADTSLTSVLPIREALKRIEDACRIPLQEMERDAEAVGNWLSKLPLPANIRLPRNSDAQYFHDMFTPRQLAGLALLKASIEREPERAVRDLLLLAWSASIAKLNKTFLSSKGRAASRGGSSIFSIYRYKLAAQYIELPIWETFAARVLNVIEAKNEVLCCRRYLEQTTQGTRILDSNKDFRVLSEDASQLPRVLEPQSIDYIFTDPPYGAFISYLDLSILWNHWLGFPISDDAHLREAIVGGERDLSEQHYKQSLRDSVSACVALLKPDRWFSIVFQHWDLTYFAAILESATEAGAELRTAITQTGDVIWSMHKKKNSASVLAGEMILTFYKPARVAKKTLPTPAAPRDPELVLSEVFDACLLGGIHAFTSELLFNRLIIELWNRRALTCLNLDRREFIRQLAARGWYYDSRTHLWSRDGQTLLAAEDSSLFDVEEAGKE